MSGADTLDFLMKGGWFTLEQSGRLVNDARLLYDAGSYSSAVGLALLSREELAKSKEFFKLWIRASRGEAVTPDMAVDEIEAMNHQEKQRRGGGSFSISVDAWTLRVLLREEAPERYDDVVTRQRLRIERLMKRAPSDRVRQRERAFYVDAADNRGSWLRPVDITRDEAETIIEDARADYWQQHRVPGIPALEQDLQRLHAALAEWSEKPALPSADWST